MTPFTLTPIPLLRAISQHQIGNERSARSLSVPSIFLDLANGRGGFVSVATPAEPRGEKKLFVQILGGEKLLKFVESASEIFLSGLRGAKNISVAFRIVYRIFFCVFQTVFRIDVKFFGGSFVLQTCRPKGLGCKLLLTPPRR